MSDDDEQGETEAGRRSFAAGGESPGFAELRRADLGKLRRKTLGKLALDQSVEDQRAGFTRLLALTEVGMPEHRCEPRSIAGVDCLELHPADLAGERERTLLYVHGGGYSLGSPVTHRPLAARVARRARARALLPAYRRAPEHPCPAGLEDVLAVWQALPDATRARTILAGDSAGGGLALALAMLLRDRGLALPRGLVLLSPWTDLTLSGDSIDELAEREVMLRRPGLEFMAARYCGDLDRRDFRVSPLFGRFEGLPPTLIQVGGHEVLLDDARRAAERAEAAGVNIDLQIWERQVHVFQATPLLAAASDAVRAIGSWIDETLVEA